MSSRSPFEELERMFERLSRQFEDQTRKLEPGGSLARSSSALESMAIDLVEHDDEFVATVDLPGFERDEVDVKVTDRTLRIEAERDETIDENEEQYIRHERRHESTRRSIRLPEAVDTEAATARMKNGVLTVTLPRLESESARRIDVE